MAIIATLKQGQQYLEIYPQVPKLTMIFPEPRIIKATKFAQKLMPFIAVFAVVWQQLVARNDNIAFAATVLTAIFALCVPLQGLYWLGKRAGTELCAQSAGYFQQILLQLKEQKIAISSKFTSVEKPTYFDLAKALSLAEQHLDQEFWQQI